MTANIIDLHEVSALSRVCLMNGICLFFYELLINDELLNANNFRQKLRNLYSEAFV